jgi:selenocysteine lyase/cysteine desulfurase
MLARRAHPAEWLESASRDDELFASLRATELGRVDRARQAYLDWTGAALHPESLVRRHVQSLRDTVLGNPHSDSVASRASTALIERARAAVLRFLDGDPDEYDVCFTANASGALRLVGEAYPFEPGSELVVSADNHNSVNGIRSYARKGGASVRVLGLDAELRLEGGLDALGEEPVHRPSLLAFPAQSNFSGVRHPLALIGRARELGLDVMLDAASFLPTSALSLREWRPDFVALSLYKIVGYPPGVGALVARREALARLRRPWFAGGTVEAVSAWDDVHVLKRDAEAFEDGTVNFLGLAAVPAAVAFMERIGMARIGRHATSMGVELRDRLGALRHANGAPVVALYGAGGSDRGATLAFNVLDAFGAVVPYWHVEARARERGVSLRGGCFCNPGAAERALGIDAGALAACLRVVRERGLAFSHAWLAECLGTPVGAVRMSLGYGSVAADVARGVDVIAEWTT